MQGITNPTHRLLFDACAGTALSFGIAQAQTAQPAAAATTTATPAMPQLTIDDIYDRMKAAGYRDLREIEFEKGRYEVKARNAQGERVKLGVDNQHRCRRARAPARLSAHESVATQENVMRNFATPESPASTYHRLSIGTHWLTLVLLIAVYALTELCGLYHKGKPVPFFGLELPALVRHDKTAAKTIEGIHEFIGNVGYGLISLHAAAALWHHVLRDNTLHHMWPPARPRLPAAPWPRVAHERK